MEMEAKRRTVKALVSRLGSVSEQSRSLALSELRQMSKEDSETRPLISDAGAIPYLTETLYSPSTETQENATATLLNLSISSRETLMSTRGLLDALSHVLLNPTSPSAAQSAAATVYSLLVVDDYRPIVGSKRDIVYALVDIVRNCRSHPRSIKDALKALFGISLYPLNRATVIELGAISALFSLVLKESRIGLVEDATAVIAQIAGCEEAAEEFRRVSGVGVLVDVLDPCTGSSGRTRENAVSALLNLVQCGGEQVANYVRQEMGDCAYGGIEEVAENGSSKGKNKAEALLKILDEDDAGSCCDAQEHGRHHHHQHQRFDSLSMASNISSSSSSA